MPLNIKEFHWVLGYIDLRKRYVYFYDSALTYDTDKEAFRTLWIMLLYILRAANFFERHPDIKKHMEKFSLLCRILSKTKKMGTFSILKWLYFLYSLKKQCD